MIVTKILKIKEDNLIFEKRNYRNIKYSFIKMIKCRRKKLYNINNRYLSFNSVKNSKKSFQDKKEIFIFLFINSLISSFFIKIENEIY